MYHIFFIHSSVDGHLGCSHVLAIVNKHLSSYKLVCLLPIHSRLMWIWCVSAFVAIRVARPSSTSKKITTH